MTNKKIAELKEMIGQAHDIRNNATGLYRIWRDSFNEEVAKIRRNRDLTLEGQDKMIDALKKRKEIEVMQLADSQISLYRKTLDTVYKEADKIAFAELPEVDAEKSARFEKSFGELKTKIMLADPQKSHQLLAEFVAGTEDQALVDRVRGEFAAIIGPIIGKADLQTRHKFNDLFEETRVKALGQEGVEALRVMESAENMRGSRFWSGIVTDNLAEVSLTAKQNFENPEVYFAERPGALTANTTLRSMEESIIEVEHGQ